MSNDTKQPGHVNWPSLGAAEYERLAQAHATPYYLYDVAAIRRRIEAVRGAFAGAAHVYYAVKANPNLELLRALHDTADGLDISSGGELEQALAAGYEAEHLSFAGPAKTVEELRASVTAGVGNISVESVRELNDCIRIANELGKPADIVLRVNPEFLNRAFGLKMGGRAVQFGVDEETLGDVLPLIEAAGEHLRFHGIHIYAGSQCFDADAVVDGVENSLRIAREIESTSSLVCRVINLGGGFGISHTEADKELDIVELGEKLTPILQAFHASGDTERHIVFELGRYLTADAGLYVTRVISEKASRGKQFYTADGGLHHHLAAAGTFGAAFRANFMLENLSHPTGEPIKCSIAGSSCNPTDLLASNAQIAQPHVGDLVGVLRSGSYGLTASPIQFLGHRTPVELIKDGDRVYVARVARGILDLN
ncbi:MAG: alanine racemase [Gammaproteobacteria bacterium]